ncbi:DNA mismatch repair protein [Aspergillus sclerotialis]|uniref:DNA mismatch repair protein n=1 Tax=Aspergillus sclerotialis TaxID=2070753 RepID=A0A3A2ZUV0_9EURO|nr:DNA mismatch repair protein [Aspergillus sclerotialis]
MPIEALSQTTIRAIGSSSVISDACSIVKELLDNALDASASTIVIEISQNTLDVIQVKDNGHGIPAEDHTFVCRRSFTSKINTVDDLKNIGGKYLGFRGVALASAAEMSSSVTVTTRVEAELTGSSVKYGRNGEIISTQRASHPVGTTVRISDFLKYIPVRRQTALRNTAKTLARIKKMVQSYAMSQPSKRLSFKVLKAKNESNNWMYAPVQNATLIDAALKTVGSSITSCCMTKNWPLENGAMNSEQVSRKDLSGYKMIAILPKSDADFSRLNNAGQYFNVDGRPLSTSRGIGRDVVKLYKSYLRTAASRSEQSLAITDPFLCLHIQCPQGSYDVNIEPAKDDLLFEDPQLILSLVESVFQESYGELTVSFDNGTTSNKRASKISNNDAFELLLARKSPVSPSLDERTPNSRATSTAYTIPPSDLRASVLPDSFDDDMCEGTLRQETTPQALEKPSSKDLESLNPWVITRMNVSNNQPPRACSVQLMNSHVSMPTATEGSRQLLRDKEARYQQSASSSALTSPTSSAFYSTATSPGTRQSPSSLRNTSQSTVIAASYDSKKEMRERDKDRYGNGALDTWFKRTTGAALLQHSVDSEAEQEQEEPPLSQLADAQFGPEERSSSRLHAAEEDLETVRMPFGSMSDNRQRVMSPLQAPDQSPEISPQRQPSPSERSPCERNQLSEDSRGLNDALDFERRKKETIQRQREQMRSRLEPSAHTNSPHRSRYLAARAALASESNSATQSQHTPSEESLARPALDHNDPRAYLMRQQNVQQPGSSQGQQKIQRAQTRKLPLEKIPEGYDLHDISLTVPAKISQLSKTFTKISETDLYTQNGVDFQSFPAKSEDPIQLWIGKLSPLIKGKYRTKDGSQEPDLQFDLTAIEKHFSSCNEDGDANV